MQYHVEAWIYIRGHGLGGSDSGLIQCPIMMSTKVSFGATVAESVMEAEPHLPSGPKQSFTTLWGRPGLAAGDGKNTNCLVQLEF